MDFGRALLAVGAGDRPPSFDIFAEELAPEWFFSALAMHGRVTLRRRRLPAENAMWLIIGMAMFRDRPISAVVHHLDLVLPDAGGKPLTSGAIVKARDRLGVGPMESLFNATAKHWAYPSADAHRWRGFALFGVDGSTLRVADTPENDARFGRPLNERSTGGYPQLRLVALMVLRSHLLAGLSLGAYSQSESALAQSLWALVSDQSLTILDRGFIDYGLLHRLQTTGTNRHWLIRARSDLRWRVLEKRSANDFLVEITSHIDARRKHPQLPKTFNVRVITYRRKGFGRRTLLTSLLDSEAYPAREIATLYHERWELELGFDEVKTHQLEREESLRSRDPDRTLQEVWGLAIAYNLVRRHMEKVAATTKLPPTRFSFRGVLLLMRDFWRVAWFMAPGSMPKQFEFLRQQMAHFLLPPRRQRKSYPRAVKIKQSPYARKL